MPLQQIHWNGPASGWAVWQVSETEEELSSVLPSGDRCPEEIRFHLKRVEWSAGRHLVRHLFTAAGLTYQGLRKDAFGKPFAVGSEVQVALSNSFPFVAAQIHPSLPVGIDLEKPRKNLARVLDRILSQAERKDAGADPKKMLIYWCAKEAMFKIHGERNLVFARDLSIAPFNRSSKGTIDGSIKKEGRHAPVRLDYCIHSEYTVVTTNTDE